MFLVAVVHGTAVAGVAQRKRHVADTVADVVDLQVGRRLATRRVHVVVDSSHG